MRFHLKTNVRHVWKRKQAALMPMFLSRIWSHLQDGGVNIRRTSTFFSAMIAKIVLAVALVISAVKVTEVFFVQCAISIMFELMVFVHNVEIPQLVSVECYY